MNEADVFFHPEQAFLRVEAAVEVFPDAASVQFELFPDAHLTSIWVPGMQSYALDRRPSATRVTVSLREVPSTPQLLEIAYEGFLDMSQVVSGELGPESLWFPYFDPAVSLDRLILRLPLESDAIIAGNWQDQFSPTERIYQRSTPDQTKTIQFAGGTTPDDSDLDQKFDSDPEPDPASDHDPVQETYPVSEPESDSEPDPDPVSEPESDSDPDSDRALDPDLNGVPTDLDLGIESPEQDISADDVERPALDNERSGPPIPLPDRERYVRQAWAERADRSIWSSWLVDALQVPDTLDQIEGFVTSLQWPALTWETRRQEFDSAITIVESHSGAGSLNWRLEWWFDGREWLVRGLSTKPMPAEITDHRLPLFQEWTERWLHQPWQNHAFWWQDILPNAHLRRGLERFLDSLGTNAMIEIIDLRFHSANEGSLSVWLDNGTDAFLVEAVLTGEEQSWILSSYQITPW